MIKDFFEFIRDICNDIYRYSMKFINTLWNRSSPENYKYEGALCSYWDFLYPLLCEIKEFSFLPDKPIFLLIDDADNLSRSQTEILNTWVSYRTSAKISLKISTQNRYKTFRTMSGITIDTPHDYSEISIGTIYTSSKKKYRERIAEIVFKRLINYKIIKSRKSISIKEKINDDSLYFTENHKQEEKINKLYN